MNKDKKTRERYLKLTCALPDRNISVVETSSSDIILTIEEDYPINIGGKIEFFEKDYSGNN